jgi:hypothetical protein
MNTFMNIYIYIYIYRLNKCFTLYSLLIKYMHTHIGVRRIITQPWPPNILSLHALHSGTYI